MGQVNWALRDANKMTTQEDGLRIGFFTVEKIEPDFTGPHVDGRLGNISEDIRPAIVSDEGFVASSSDYSNVREAKKVARNRGSSNASKNDSLEGENAEINLKDACVNSQMRVCSIREEIYKVAEINDSIRFSYRNGASKLRGVFTNLKVREVEMAEE